MARPCVGCGFQVDSNGYLAINGIANVTYPYAAQTSSPNDIFCDSTSSELWIKPWSVPWGVIRTASVTAATTSTSTTIVTVGGLTVTFTPVVNRRYKITVNGHKFSSNYNDLIRHYVTDGQATPGGIAAYDHIEGNNGAIRYATSFTSVSYETFASTASVSRGVGIARQAGAGTVTLFADALRPATIVVEDIGPV